MAITNPDLIYVAKYDIYVSRSTRTFYKRCHRGRKTEITDSELVLMDKFLFSTTEYIRLKHKIGGKTCNDCISYVFAEAFPELVGNADLHEKYPYLYTELNHKNHVHNTWESNYPECMEWQIPSINRADTSRNVEKNDPNDRRLLRSKRKKEWYQKKKLDSEWMDKKRKREAEYRMNQYYETKPLRKQQEAELAEQLLRKQQASNRHRLAEK